jgi:hypothetical protein
MRAPRAVAGGRIANDRFGSRLSLAACVAALVLLAPVWAADVSPPPPRTIAGRLEHARILPGDIVLDAKLDTGAYTASLHAENMRTLTREGESRIAFDVIDHDGRRVHLERPLIRTARVRSALGTDAKRPTVTLGICIGTVYRVTEVTLVDRSNLTTSLLIGRRYLSGNFLVDVSRDHLLRPQCNATGNP